MYEAVWAWDDGQSTQSGGDFDTLDEAMAALRWAAWKTRCDWFWLNRVEVSLLDLITLPE